MGILTGCNEYEFTEIISDTRPFTISCNGICYIKKIEIFINPVPSLEISDTDFEADAKIKEYDKTAVHFKLKRSFVADDTCTLFVCLSTLRRSSWLRSLEARK